MFQKFVPQKLLGVFSRLADPTSGLHSMSAVVHLCEAGGELTLSHEGLALRYWSLHAVPRWLGGTKKRARAAYALWASESVTAVSD